jgi:hypothetical protein
MAYGVSILWFLIFFDLICCSLISGSYFVVILICFRYSFPLPTKEAFKKGIYFDRVYGKTPEAADLRCDFLQDGHIVTSFPAITETISIVLSPVNIGL